MTDANFLVRFITRVREGVEEVYKTAHDANEDLKQTSEAYRELVSRASAALHYMDKALEAAQQALKDEMAKAATTCPTGCDNDCETDCHEEHQVPAKRSHKPEDCPSRKENRKDGEGHSSVHP